MLAIRMQRTGRKGQAHFRVIVQDSHRSPSTGKVIEYLGSYDPHTKTTQLNKEEIEKFLNNGAQPSNRVAILLEKEGYKLPKWVNIDRSAKKQTKNPEKLRKNQPDEPKVAQEPVKEEAPNIADAPAETEATKEETKEESSADATKEEVQPEEKVEEKTAEEPKAAKEPVEEKKAEKEESKEEK